ncbi:MAG: hypothetical protein AMXMBFR64_56370 [Myxococcales bacterium]
MFRVLFLGLVLAPTIGAAMEPPPRAGREYPVDGISVGQPLAEVRAREAYGEPCSMSEAAARKVVIFGAKGCKRAFTADTTAVLLVEDGKVGAIAWLGGSWFDNRTNFPVSLGTALPDGDPKSLGGAVEWPAAATLQLAEGLRATRFGPDIHILDDGARVVGIVVGAMPVDPKDLQWVALTGAWVRHTR